METVMAIVIGILLLIILLQLVWEDGARTKFIEPPLNVYPYVCETRRKSDDTLSWILAWVITLAIVAYLLYPA